MIVAGQAASIPGQGLRCLDRISIIPVITDEQNDEEDGRKLLWKH